MTDDTRYKLICLMEECAEISEQCSRVGVRVSKALRFGLTEVQSGQLLSNAERIVAELAELKALIILLERDGTIDQTQIDLKLMKFEVFRGLSRTLGTL